MSDPSEGSGAVAIPAGTAATPAIAGASSAWTPLAIPAFRNVWLASLAANIAIWLGNVGTAWLMTELRPTPVFVTLVQTAGSLPVFLFALVAGAVGDAVDRRKLLVALQLASIAVSALLGALTAIGATTPLVILVASFVFGTVFAFSMPVFQAVVPDLVPRHELAPAVSLNSIGINVARVIGPAVGGFLIVSCGTAAPFFMTTAFYLAVVPLLYASVPAAAPRFGGSWSAAVAEGIRYTLGGSETRATLIRSAGYAFCASIYFSLLPLVARNQLAGGPLTYGILLACLGLGGIAAVVLLPRWRARRHADRIARRGSIASAALLVATAMCSGLWLAAPVLLAAGAAWVAVVATVNVAAQMALPSRVRARGLSIFMIVFNGMMALGSAFWGVVADALGVPLTFAAAAVMLALFEAGSRRWRLPGIEAAT